MTKFPVIACFLLFYSVLVALLCIGDHVRGTTKPYYQRGGILLDPISRDQTPEKFRNTMAANWTKALLPGILGSLLLSLIRRQDSMDPFSPDFQSEEALRDWNSKPGDTEAKKGPDG